MSRHLVCVCSALMLIAPVQARAQDVAGATGSVRTGDAPAPPQQPAGPRRVGIALGGGSARGFAHVGVLRWLDEHRVPVDVVAGTSMGGLIAGLFAMGMSPVEIEGVLSEIDWSSMFGASDFEFRNVRRKRDARDFPFQIEFGLTPRLTLPPSLNNGQRVDLLISRLAAPYYALSSFDDLPTPLRLVTVDVIKAEPVARVHGVTGTGHARDHVAARDFSAGRSRRARFRRRRRARQHSHRCREKSGRGADHRGERRRSGGSEIGQVHRARHDERSGRDHDAGQFGQVDGGGGRRHQRAAEGLLIAGLAAVHRFDPGGLRRGRKDARPTAAARRRSADVRPVGGCARGAPSEDRSAAVAADGYRRRED